MTKPLEGVRVLDFSTTFSGPYCTMHLADLGADVVKIEAPGGDITRGLGINRESGMASVYIAANAAKASVELDLKDPDDRAYLELLIAEADAVVHNMRPQAADRIGIGVDSVMALNPTVVHLAITGYGTDGPYAGRPAYDDTIQAMSGLAWLQGLHTEPTYVATAIADKVTGLSAAMALIAGLYAREHTGEGQAIEVPMYETMVGFNLMEQWGGRAFIPAEGPTAYARLRSPHRRPYRTLDGVISVVVYHEGHWRRFLEAVGRSDILELEEYSTTEARSRNTDGLYSFLAQELETRTSAHWIELLDRLDIPVARVNSLDDLFDDEHLNAVGFFREIGPEGDRYLSARPAVRFQSDVQASGEIPAPDRLGQGRVRADAWLSNPRRS